MLLKKNQWPILLVNIIMLVLFTFFYFSAKNYEFLGYIGVIVFFIIVVVISNKKVKYPNWMLWGLTLWAFIHMAGGSFRIHGEKLYEFMIIPISEIYGVFKFDQFVHIYGFFIATLVLYHIIKPILKTNIKRWTALFIVLAMAGLGLGALNEIVEFIAVLIASETGVGGYNNTLLDLISDLIGALLAIIVIKYKEK